MTNIKSTKGSALMATIIFAVIFTVAVGALLSTAHTDYRSAHYSYLNTSAFCLAESGVDFAAEAIGTKSFASWSTAKNGGYFYRSGKIGNGNYTVVCRAITSPLMGWEVLSTGTAQNTGAKLSSQKAVRVLFSESSGSGVGNALIARDGITLGNNTTSSNQGYVRVASYKSSNGAPQWGGKNFGRNALVGVTSSSNGALAVNAATIYGSIATGGENNATVFSNFRAKNVTADQTDVSQNNVDPSKFVKNFTYDFPAPHVPNMDASWTTITPKDITDGSSQYKYSGKLSELPKSITAAKYSSGTLTVGSSNSNTFILGSSGDGLNTINVSGNVVLYFTQNANLNNTKIHLNEGASLKLYFCGDVSSIPSPDNNNFKPSRYEINVLPSGSAPNLNNTSASDIISGSLNSRIDTAAANPYASGPGVTVNYGTSGVLTATINAPFSSVQLSTGNTQGANQLRGSIVAKKITTTGGDFLDVFYDEDTNNGTSTEPCLANWREIHPSNVPTS